MKLRWPFAMRSSVDRLNAYCKVLVRDAISKLAGKEIECRQLRQRLEEAVATIVELRGERKQRNHH